MVRLNGEWYCLDLGKCYEVHGVQINFADVELPMLQVDPKLRSNVYTNNRYIDPDPNLRTRWLLEGSTDGTNWTILADKREADSDLSHDYIPLDGISLRYLRVTAIELPYHEPFALSGLRVFGRGDCDAPDPVKQVMVIRPDPLTARLDWSASGRAIGYNIRYGIAPDKLYSSHMIYGDSHVLLTTLNAGQPYYAAVDAFGEGGITAGEIVPIECMRRN